MNKIGHSGSIREIDPHDELGQAKSIADFISFVMSDFGFRGGGEDMAPSDFTGLAQILKDLGERLDLVGKALLKERETAEVDVLTRAGLPEHAYTSRELRQAWRAGFAHARDAVTNGKTPCDTPSKEQALFRKILNDATPSNAEETPHVDSQ